MRKRLQNYGKMSKGTLKTFIFYNYTCMKPCHNFLNNKCEQKKKL